MVISDVRDDLKKKKSNAITLIVILLIISLVLVVYSLSISTVKIGILESFSIFINHLCGVKPTDFLSYLKDRVVFEENGPRALGALMAGAVLGISGAVLQNIIRNPLADPYTLGISSGALFGMVVSLTLGFSIIPFLTGLDAAVVNAFIFALIPTAIVVVISTFKKVSPTMMILCGIAVMYIFNASTTMMKYTADPETFAEIFAWSIGSVSGLAWGSLVRLFIALLLVLIPMMIWHRQIDIIAQGDNQAITLGVNPNRLRIYCLIFTSLATALVVCYTGTIGFVGLVAPHIARIKFGSNCKFLIPASAVIGALMILGSDVVLRLINPSLPVGVMIALICTPFFIYILTRMNKKMW
ncbi:MAG: iron ABC transporter permease [Candidatus Methanomethylophilaceae archaeon]|nr:iron ABC transporter permease [Candidatus Methanomethylophilaceae archaeon]